VRSRLLAEDKADQEEAREITQEEANEWVRNLDSTKIMWPHKEKKRKPWSAD